MKVQSMPIAGLLPTIRVLGPSSSDRGNRMARPLSLLLILALIVTACGGGGGGGAGDERPEPTSEALRFSAGEFLPSDTFKSFCRDPRSGLSEVTGRAFDDRDGSRLEENFWLRSWTNETYYWYDEVPELNPADFSTLDYFDLLRTSDVTPSGKDKDDFHFALDTADWEAQSQTGISVSYGIDFAIVSPRVPREVVVALVEPESIADMAGVVRGDRVIAVDGVSIDDGTAAGVDIINAGLIPGDIGEVHQFGLRTADGSTRTVMLTASSQRFSPVQSAHVFDTNSGPVGYVLFTSHNSPSESLLIDAFEQFQLNNVTDLILDLRYNGGGFLAIASEVAYMIASPAFTNGRTFERLQFNDKHPRINPVTGEDNDPLPFNDRSLGFSEPSGQDLPNLGLERVIVITTGSTCSASESIINSLRGIDIEVIQIGSATCGKPYGFYPTDNCGTTYFTVQFQSVNDRGFGDYADGFAPIEQNRLGAVPLPGCFISDDYDNPIGDPNEGMLASALGYIDRGDCGQTTNTFQKPGGTLEDKSILLKTPWQFNRIVTPPTYRF